VKIRQNARMPHSTYHLSSKRVFAGTLLTIWATAILQSQHTFAADNLPLLDKIKQHDNLSEEQAKKLSAIFGASNSLGQGNPKIVQHPATEDACQEQAKKQGINFQTEEQKSICGKPHMVPLYDPKTQSAKDAKTCIDQFEFPNIPCTYPVVWVKAREAAEICKAVGKRLCDAHEWEGGCAGALRGPDYPFEAVSKLPEGQAVAAMRKITNRGREIVWAYGPKKNHQLCGTNSTKSDACNRALATGQDVWTNCGSNTYPSGFFPECHSPLGVYDQHGNAAEHMNIPVRPEQFASKGGMGHTEMKGSWFIFSKYSAHEDDCRWRAPYWHGGKVMDDHSHANYHLGFRCCADLP
jgi:formylglycine-generating enzyme required for sulfatase activity